MRNLATMAKRLAACAIYTLLALHAIMSPVMLYSMSSEGANNREPAISGDILFVNRVWQTDIKVYYSKIIDLSAYFLHLSFCGLSVLAHCLYVFHSLKRPRNSSTVIAMID